MKAKIVKFRNGRYGVRRRRWPNYEYLNEYGEWHHPSFDPAKDYGFATLKAMDEALEKYRKYNQAANDMGVPITKIRI